MLQLRAEQIPTDKRLDFIDSLCVQVQRLHPDADSLCAHQCDSWRERITSGASGKAFPYDLNRSIDYHDTWDIYLRDATGDNFRAQWYSTENACSLLVEDGFGWLHVRASKDSGLVEQFDQVLEKARDLRGIVLDVRSYYQSTAETLYKILGRFIHKPISGFRYRRRISGSNQYVEQSTTVEPRGQWTYNKPVLIVFGYDWPSCGIPDILMQRDYTDSVKSSASTGRIMTEGDGWQYYVYGLQDSVSLPYGFTAWIPTHQVMHPVLDIPEIQGRTIVRVDHPPAQPSIIETARFYWSKKQFRRLVRDYEKMEKKKSKA